MFHCLQEKTVFNPSFDLVSNLSTEIRERTIVPIVEKNKVLFLQSYFSHLEKGNIPFVINPDIPQKALRNLLQDRSTVKSGLGHFICTSGTTSLIPKNYFFDLQQVMANAQAHNQSLELKPEQNILFPLPLHHSFGLTVGIWSSIVNKAHLYFSQEILGPSQILNHLDGIDLLYLIPSQVRVLLKYLHHYKGEIKAPSKISIGSSQILEKEVFQLQQFFPKTQIYFTYGLTEMGPRVSTHKVIDPQNTDKLLPMGQPLKDVKLHIEKKTLFISSPYACKEISQPFNTQDFIENDTIKGRIDDTINYQGRLIFPDEIENLFFQTCALIGIRSKLYGEIPILVFEDEITEDEVWLRLKQNLPETHLPKRIIIGHNIPKTSLNKIKRSELKAVFEEK